MNTKWDRKEYDRLRAKKLYKEFQDRRKFLIENVFGNQCACCHKKNLKGFHLHHILYDKNSQYPRHSKSMWIREKRLKEAELEPHKFKLLCGKCHRFISILAYYVEDGIDLHVALSLVPKMG